MSKTESPDRRRRLAELDGLLGELERLNLANRTEVPQDLAIRLEKFGIRSAARKRPPQLIEVVFDLQRPFLRSKPSAVGIQDMTTKRPRAVEGWMLV